MGGCPSSGRAAKPAIVAPALDDTASPAASPNKALPTAPASASGSLTLPLLKGVECKEVQGSDIQPPPRRQLYEGKATWKQDDGSLGTLAWVSATLAFAQHRILLTDARVTAEAGSPGGRLAATLATLVMGDGAVQSLEWDGTPGGEGAVHDSSGTWAGSAVCQGGGIKLSNHGEGLQLELEPQPFRYHFALSGHRGESSELGHALAAKLNGLCKPSSLLRFCFLQSGEDRAQMIRDSGSFILLITPGVWQDLSVCKDVLLAEQLGKIVLLLYQPDEHIHVHKPSVITFAELQVRCVPLFWSYHILPVARSTIMIIIIIIKGHSLRRACLQPATNTQSSKPRPPTTNTKSKGKLQHQIKHCSKLSTG